MRKHLHYYYQVHITYRKVGITKSKTNENKDQRPTVRYTVDI